MNRRIVDLTFPVHQGMLTFPCHWHPVVEVTVMGRLDIEKRETRQVVLGSHTGTHCDAPRHFIPDGETVDNLLLDILVGPARIINLSASRPLEEIGVSRLKDLLGDRRPERLVLRYDWSREWGKDTYYTDYPFLALDVADWLVGNGVKLLAMDTPSPDNPAHGRDAEPDSPLHKTLLGNGVVLVEYLCNLSGLKRPEVELIVLPLKLKDGDGAPARVVAIEP